MIAAQRAPAIEQPVTDALRLALSTAPPHSIGDLLFLERWELSPMPATADVLRAVQVRRANPELAAAIRAELMARARRR